MSLQPLGLGERDRRRRELAQLFGAELEDRCPLHEIEHRKAGGEARRASRRQHVVAAGDIVADGDGRVAPEEDRSGISDGAEKRLRIGDAKLEVFRRDAVDERIAS